MILPETPRRRWNPSYLKIAILCDEDSDTSPRISGTAASKYKKLLPKGSARIIF